MNLVAYLVDRLDNVTQALTNFKDLSDYERSYKIGELTYLVGELKKEIKKSPLNVKGIKKRR